MIKTHARLDYLSILCSVRKYAEFPYPPPQCYCESVTRSKKAGISSAYIWDYTPKYILVNFGGNSLRNRQKCQQKLKNLSKAMIYLMNSKSFKNSKTGNIGAYSRSHGA